MEPLSERIIAGEVKTGDHIVVDRAGDGLTIRSEERAAA